MNTDQNGRLLDEAIRRAVGSETVRFDAAEWMKKHREEIAMLESRKTTIAPGAKLPLMERIRHMNKLIKYPAAAIFTMAVLFGVTYLLLGPHAESTFADVRQQFEQTQTLTLTATSEATVMGKTVKTRVKMYFKTPGLMRMESMFGFNQMGLQGPTSRPTARPAVKSVAIMDMNSGKGVSLVPAQRLAITMDLQNLPFEAKARMNQQNFLDQIKKSVAGEHKDLGEKTIDDRKAKGYRCSLPDMPQATIDIWVEVATGKPLVVEQQVSPEAGMGSAKIVMTDFVLNPSLDDSLFDTKVPEGYQVMMNQSVDYNVTEGDLIAWLKELAQNWKGTFPRSLFAVPEPGKPTNTMASPASSQPASKPMKAVVATALNKMQVMQKALIFQMRSMQGGEFIYGGHGVKLGEKDRPIVWYKGKDAKTWRVIYGDLHAEDTAVPPRLPARYPSTGKHVSRSEEDSGGD